MSEEQHDGADHEAEWPRQGGELVEERARRPQRPTPRSRSGPRFLGASGRAVFCGAEPADAQAGAARAGAECAGGRSGDPPPVRHSSTAAALRDRFTMNEAAVLTINVKTNKEKPAASRAARPELATAPEPGSR